MGVWAAIPAIAGVVTAALQARTQARQRQQRQNNVAAYGQLASEVGQNILSGMNNRAARRYNLPEKQVKRLLKAGLPLAAGSNITAGGGVATPTNSVGSQFNDNIGKSTIRQIDKEKLQIAKQELRTATALANLTVGNAKNQLNPSGIFENTNQGTGLLQLLGQQEEAIKAAKIVNQFMPSEKYLNLLKSTKEIESLSQNIKIAAVNEKIAINDLAVKKILLKYQDKMSLQQLQSLIKENASKDLRNTGMGLDNASKQLALTFEYRILEDKVKVARNAALASDQALEAGRLNLLLTNLSLPSTEAYYKIRRGMDDATIAKPNLPNTLLYLGMFQPNTSNYNFGQLIPRIPSAGNTYNTHHNIYQKD